MNQQHPLQGICQTWCGLAKKAAEHKEKAFGAAAKECWKFFDQSHDFMYANNDSKIGLSNDEIKTTFRVTCNKVAEFVRVYGPSLYFRNPARMVSPRIPDVPDMAFQGMDPQTAQTQQQQLQLQTEAKKAEAMLLQWYLNYLPNELDLKGESRMATDEGLIKGRGILWHEMYSPPDSDVVMPRSYFVSVDDLLIDPDAEKLEDATWIMRRRCQPMYQVEERFGLERDSLKDGAKGESIIRQASVERDDKYLEGRKRGETQDLFVYYEIWSKCGLGQYLKTTQDNSAEFGDLNEMRDALDQFGKYCYLAVADGIDYPLNLPPEAMELDVEQPENLKEIKGRVGWPIPFYLDAGNNCWPFTECDFYPIPRSVWPQSPLKPGLGELKAINWIMSFLVGRIRVTSRTFIGLLESVDEETQTAILEGGDLTVLKLKGVLGKKIEEMVQFLNHPNVNTDIWNVIDRLMALFDKRVGLAEGMYGQTETQSRSAADSDVKSSQMNVRPGDMAETVETWQSRVSRKEGIMARLYIGPQQVAEILGEPFNPQQMQFGLRTAMWAKLVYRPFDPANTKAAQQVIREFDYRIEAGSIRKPNRARDQQNMDQAMTTFFPSMLGHYQQSGDPQQLNELMKEWAKTRDLDVSGLLYQPNPQPPPPTPEQQAQSHLALSQQQAEVDKTRADAQKLMADMQLSLAKAGQAQQESQAALQTQQTLATINGMDEQTLTALMQQLQQPAGGGSPQPAQAAA